MFRFVFCMFFVSTVALAQTKAPEQILNKSSRTLPPPPANLRANDEAGRSKFAREDVEPGFEKTGDLEKVEVKSSDTIEMNGVAEDGESQPKKRSLGTGFNGTRLFGMGLVGAGAYGIFGGELRLGFGNEWEMGAGIGTGLNYSTWAVNSRFYFFDGEINPFAEFGYANWTLRRLSSNGEKPKPHFIASRFFEDKGTYRLGATRNLLYPGIGVLYQNPSGIAFLFQLQYFINIKNTNGALYGSLGAFYYF